LKSKDRFSAAHLISVILYLVYQPPVSRIKVSADMLEIVNEAIPVHPLFQG
jgi:hypothetical protein